MARAVDPTTLPRHLTRLTIKVTPGGALRIRLHTAARATWFIGESTVEEAARTADLLAQWSTAARAPADDAAWWRWAGVQVGVPQDRLMRPVLWDPPAALDVLFEAAFVARKPSRDAGSAFGMALAHQVADFVQRSRAAARACLADGWAERAQSRLDAVRRIVDVSQQGSGGRLAAELGAQLRAEAFMALAPDDRARRLFRDLGAEQQSLYSWEQALGHLGISAPRGSGAYP